MFSLFCSLLLMAHLFSLAGKIGVVTGGSGGIALAISRYLLQAGASVALVDNNLPRLESAAQELAKWYGKSKNAKYAVGRVVSSWACDISNVVQVESTFRAIRDHYGDTLNVLINAAGYCENISAVDYPSDKLRRIIDVNLNGSLFVAREFAKLLIAEKKPGSIILVASMSGSIVNYPQEQTPYNVSKAAVIHMAKSLASEWAKYGIRVNSLSPGYTLTALTRAILENDTRLKTEWESKIPLGRMAEPEELAGPILFMASDASSYMTGHNLIIDGGYTVW